MKLKINGIVDAEIVEGTLSVEDIRSMLKKLGEAQDTETAEGIKNATAKVSPYSSKSNQQGKLNAKPKMPI